MPEEIVAVLIVLIVIGLPVVCMTLIKLAKIMKGDSSRTRTGGRSRGSADIDEAQLMQDLHRGLSRLESRIESLETIVLERESSKERTR